MIKVYKTLFECDPRKNKECRKTGCYINGGPCHLTQFLRFAKMTSPSSYAELQKKQTADLYARIEVKDEADRVDTDKEASP